MKVIYSVAAKLGGSGIGTTAYQACLGIFKAGYLKKTFCGSKAIREIPADILYSTNVSFFESLPFLPSAYQWLLKDVTHDLITSMNLPKVVKGSTSTSSLRSDEVTDFRGGLDIFHVWNGHGLRSARVAKKMGARIVIERASSHPQTFERIMNQEYRIRGLRFGQMIGFNKQRLLQEFAEADFITVPSDFSHQSMVENGVPEEKLVKIPFGTDLSRFRPVWKKTGSSFEVLFAGQVGLRKGVLYLLEAWQKIKLAEARLTVVGQRDAEIRPFLRKFESDPSIRFLEYSDLLPLYQASDLFVFPSLEEGSALVIYEALACGLPVITTFESGSVVTDGQEGYLVPSRRVDALAEKIKFFYENRALVEAMSQKARAKAAGFSWEKYGQKLVRFYEGLL